MDMIFYTINSQKPTFHFGALHSDMRIKTQVACMDEMDRNNSRVIIIDEGFEGFDTCPELWR